jgi:hypothetical protein
MSHSNLRCAIRYASVALVAAGLLSMSGVASAASDKKAATPAPARSAPAARPAASAARPAGNSGGGAMQRPNAAPSVNRPIQSGPSANHPTVTGPSANRGPSANGYWRWSTSNGWAGWSARGWWGRLWRSGWSTPARRSRIWWRRPLSYRIPERQRGARRPQRQSARRA